MADGISRLTRSIELIAASGNVLRTDPELLVLPALSGLASLAVLALFGWGAFSFGLVPTPPADGGDMPMSPALYAFTFVLYFVEYFVIIFFNTALVGAAIAKLSGGEVSVGSALALAVSRIGPILGYALVSATIGMVLRAVAERFGFVGRIIEGIVGLMWTVATFLVVPVLAAEGIGPIKAIQRSTAMLHETWGENLIGNAGITVVSSILGAILIVGGVGGGMMAFAQGHMATAISMFAVSGVLMLAVILIGTALSGIYSGAVYYFALTGEAPNGFDAALIKGSFTRRES